MAKTYIIHNSIIYTPLSHNLFSIEKNESITLATPASLCFNLLIENRGKIISQDELLHVVWGTRGMNVTQNTLHQNISLLRKSLRRLGINTSAIQTIPRRGFMFPADILVMERDDEHDLPPFHYEDDTHTNKIITIRDKVNESIFLGSAIKPASKEGTETNEKEKSAVQKTAVSPSSTLQRRRETSRWGYFIILICLLLMAIKLIQKNTNEHNPLASYRKLPNVGACTIFRSNDMRSDNFFMDLIEAHHIECKKTKVIYITNYYPSSRISLISCKNPLESDKRSYCISTYYLK